ncbi:MAG: iron chelate uptake ABC transporter family permease subunit [Pseudomonadota bacterium]
MTWTFSPIETPGQLRWWRILKMLCLASCLGMVALAAVAIGAKAIPLGDIVNAVYAFDVSNPNHVIIIDLRLPRLVQGLLVGASLGVAGVLMQSITRNPLADPGLLGLNAGAALAVVLAIWHLDLSSQSSLVWFAFAGTGTASILVYFFGAAGRGGATPVRLALAGAALNAMLFSIVSAILITQRETMDVYRFWIAGSLGNAETATIAPLLPYTVLGFAIALAIARDLNALSLGHDLGRSLGTRMVRAHALTLIAVTLLCGTSVAMAGPIGFIGLVIPHIGRALFGPDLRPLLLAAATLGPIVLLTADIAGRVVLPPGEIEVGIVAALVGGPLFVWIVRRIRLGHL